MYIYIYWVTQKICSSFPIIKSYRKIQTNILANSIYLVCVCVFLCVLVAQSFLTLRDLMDYSPPGSTVHGILQSRILEWVAISFSMGSSLLRHQTWVSHTAVRFFTIWATREAHSLWLCIYIYLANLENTAVATGLEKAGFHSNPKESQCQRMFKLPHSCTHLTS